MIAEICASDSPLDLAESSGVTAIFFAERSSLRAAHVGEGAHAACPRGELDPCTSNVRAVVSKLAKPVSHPRSPGVQMTAPLPEPELQTDPETQEAELDQSSAGAMPLFLTPSFAQGPMPTLPALLPMFGAMSSATSGRAQSPENIGESVPSVTGARGNAPAKRQRSSGGAE